MSSSNVNAASIANETEFSYGKSFVFLFRALSIIKPFFNFVDIAPMPTVCRLRIDADDAGQTCAEIGAKNWDQTPAKGWKIEKKLGQVGSVSPGSAVINSILALTT